MAKGETAHWEQFLLLPQCFQQSFPANVSVGGESLDPFHKSAAINSKCVSKKKIENLNTCSINRKVLELELS